MAAKPIKSLELYYTMIQSIMFTVGPHQLYAALIWPALTNKSCMYVCM